MIKPDLKKGLDDKIENLFRREFIRKVGLGLVAISTIGLAELVLGNTNASAQSNEPIKPDMSQYELNLPKTNNPPAENYDQIIPTKDFYELSRSEINSMSWSELKPYLNTPEKAYDFVVDYSGIKYQEETGEYIQSSEKTFELRTGDCDDFAYLMMDALNYNGFYAKMLSTWLILKGEETAHANTVYFDRKTKEWHYIQPYDTNDLKKGISKGYSDPEIMAREISRKIGGKYSNYVIQGIEEIDNRPL